MLLSHEHSVIKENPKMPHSQGRRRDRRRPRRWGAQCLWWILPRNNRRLVLWDRRYQLQQQTLTPPQFAQVWKYCSCAWEWKIPFRWTVSTTDDSSGRLFHSDRGRGSFPPEPDPKSDSCDSGLLLRFWFRFWFWRRFCSSSSNDQGWAHSLCHQWGEYFLFLMYIQMINDNI